MKRMMAFGAYLRALLRMMDKVGTTPQRVVVIVDSGSAEVVVGNLSFTNPTPEGCVEEVVTEEEAIRRQVNLADRNNHAYSSKEAALYDFMICNHCTFTRKPVGIYKK